MVKVRGKQQNVVHCIEDTPFRKKYLGEHKKQICIYRQLTKEGKTIYNNDRKSVKESHVGRKVQEA